MKCVWAVQYAKVVMIWPDKLAVNHIVNHFKDTGRKKGAIFTNFVSERKEIVPYFDHVVYTTETPTDQRSNRQTETGDVAHDWSSGRKDKRLFLSVIFLM